MELLLNHREPCLECGSGEPYYKCCGWKVEEERGGVLWPMYHCCECDDAYDKDYNPKGGPGCVVEWWAVARRRVWSCV